MSEDNKQPAPTGALLLSKQELDRLEKEHGEIYAANVKIGGVKVTLAFSYPTETQFRFYMDAIAPGEDEAVSGSTMFDAAKTLLRDCVLHPGVNKLNEIFAKRPGLVQRLIVKLQSLVAPKLEDIKNG